MPQSYKIFIKDVPLVFTSAQNAHVLNGFKALQSFNENSVNELITTITKLGPPAEKGYYFLHDEPDQIFQLIKNTLELVPAAGGIVWNNDFELLMIYRRGKWDLPKGKIEEGESVETAALREVEEESGIGKLRLIEKFDTSYHIYPERNRWLLKETHWFEMLSNDNGAAKPQTSEGITKALWIPRKEVHLKLKNTYASIYDLVGRVLMHGYTSAEGIE